MPQESECEYLVYQSCASYIVIILHLRITSLFGTKLFILYESLYPNNSIGQQLAINISKIYMTNVYCILYCNYIAFKNHFFIRLQKTCQPISLIMIYLKSCTVIIDSLPMVESA